MKKLLVGNQYMAYGIRHTTNKVCGVECCFNQSGCTWYLNENKEEWMAKYMQMILLG